MITIYRDRLVLAAPLDNPHNFYFSRVGGHTDWDYTQTDHSTTGRVGEPLLDDYLK